MSLNWNISKVANKDTVCFNYPEGESGPRALRGLTERLIWATLVVDLGKITAKNIDEWLFRLDVAARVYEDRDGFGAIDREDLTKHIGLETNVIDTTRAGFLRKMTKSLERQGNAAVRSSEAVAA
jgi:hypothetical protein